MKLIRSMIFSKDNIENEWEELIFRFDTIQDLPNFIKKYWKRKQFMEFVFEFLDEAYFCFDEKKKQKADEICSIICDLYVEGSQGKSKYWKYRHVLYQLSDFFSEENN